MHWRGTSNRRGRLAAVVAALLALAVAGCGDDEPAGAGAGDTTVESRPTETVDRTAKANAADTTATTVPADGRLTTPGGRVVTDWGDKRDNRAAVAALVDLQRAFQAGQMEEACTGLASFLLSQFHPGDTRAGTACPRKLEAYAQQLAEKGAEHSRMKVLWVRSYGTSAGVWVDDGRERYQIPLTSNGKRGGAWQLELGAIQNATLLNAEATGTARFGVD